MTNVLLYSGGMDSFMAWYLLTKDGTPWVATYVDLDTRYTRKELKTMTELEIPFERIKFPLGAIEQEDAFVPQRNALLITLAQAWYNADAVALAAVRGEFSRDKHPKFFKQISELLSYTSGKTIDAFTPFAKLTKSEAVREYLSQGGDTEALLKTVSCYDAQAQACGKCMSCYRRWVALSNNGLVHEASWDSPPADWIKDREQPPLTKIVELPFMQWGDFARAQIDAVRAHRRSR